MLKILCSAYTQYTQNNWPNQNFFLTKPQHLSITNYKKVLNSKSEPKKFSRLCTFKQVSYSMPNPVIVLFYRIILYYLPFLLISVSSILHIALHFPSYSFHLFIDFSTSFFISPGSFSVSPFHCSARVMYCIFYCTITYFPETGFTKKQNPEASLWIFQRFLNPRASPCFSFLKS